MAVVKKGKIHGKIGNYVYRVVNNQEIIQSLPRFRKKTKKRLAENASFAECSRMNSKIYRLIKDFALDLLGGSFYNHLFSYIKLNFFTRKELFTDPRFSDWGLLADTGNIPINEQLGVKEILHRNPTLRIEGNGCIVEIPKYKFIRSRRYYIENVNYLEYSVSLVHYDFKEGTATPIFDWNSGRFIQSTGLEAQRIEIPFEFLGDALNNGLVFVCFAVRLFTSRESYGYVNTREYNPTCLLGVAFKQPDL